MKLPFSENQFLDVFGAYNRALWPMAASLWLATAVLVALWLAGRLRSGRWLGGLLAFHWAWSGVAYHLAFFAGINPAARVFAAAFLVQALAFAWLACARPAPRFVARGTRRSILPVGLVLYSLAYPFLGLLFGLEFPRMPTFGVPCPTALLTAGLLLSVSPPVPRGLLVIPVLWCAIGGSAALLLGIRADLALLLAGAALLAGFVRRGPAAAAPSPAAPTPLGQGREAG